MVTKKKCRPVAPGAALGKTSKNAPDSKQKLPVPSTKIQATSIAGPVRSNTLEKAVATPTESGVLSCLDYGADCGLSTAMPYGFGRGAVDREAIGVAFSTFETPRHRMHVQMQTVDFSVQKGTETMKPTVKPGALPATTHTDHLALTQRATNSLSMALWHIRHSSEQDSIQLATGRAVSAARALKQLCAMEGGAHHE